MVHRLLVSCFPGHGHLNPLLPLVTACRRAGWEVLVSTGPGLARTVERHGLTATPTGISATDNEATLLAHRPDIPQLTGSDRMRGPCCRRCSSMSRRAPASTS